MALVKMLWILGRTLEDNVQWSFAFDDFDLLITPAELEDLVDDMVAAWQGTVTQTRFPADLQLERVEIYAAGGGPAVAIHLPAAPIPLGTGAAFGPEELAVCVTEHVPGTRGPRAAGRLYFGPLAASETASRRPPAGLLDDVRAFMVAMHAAVAGAPHNLNPVVISRFLNNVERNDPVAFNIIQYSTDDAWDVQRRRGADPSARSFSGLLERAELEPLVVVVALKVSASSADHRAIEHPRRLRPPWSTARCTR